MNHLGHDDFPNFPFGGIWNCSLEGKHALNISPEILHSLELGNECRVVFVRVTPW